MAKGFFRLISMPDDSNTFVLTKKTRMFLKKIGETVSNYRIEDKRLLGNQNRPSNLNKKKSL